LRAAGDREVPGAGVVLRVPLHPVPARHPQGAGPGGEDRRRGPLQDLLLHPAAAAAAGGGDLVDLHVHLVVERLPRAVDLPVRHGEVPAAQAAAVLFEHRGCHELGWHDGDDAAVAGPGGAVLPGLPEVPHQGHRDLGREGLTMRGGAAGMARGGNATEGTRPFALFAECLLTGVWFAVAALPLVTVPAALAASSRHLRGYLEGTSSSLGDFVRDVRLAWRGGWKAGLAVIGAALFLAVDLAVLTVEGVPGRPVMALLVMLVAGLA